MRNEEFMAGHPHPNHFYVQYVILSEVEES